MENLSPIILYLVYACHSYVKEKNMLEVSIIKHIMQQYTYYDSEIP